MRGYKSYSCYGCVCCIFSKDYLFADYARIIAYDSSGVKWETKRLAFDGFKILKVTGNDLFGEYYDLRSELMAKFEIDLETGDNRGESIEF